MADRCS
ncbi:9080a8a5-5b07-4736-8eed-8e2cf05a56f9 [Thermothielavioides terrestris]|nr:9080a8a5-5b07-4736-8eed-8e2cf05a56f9 [Thermothielavioides terrestris]